MSNILEERQKNRWLLLRKVYEMAEGISEKDSINVYKVGEQLGWNLEETEAAFDYLQGEGLLKGVAVGGGIKLTHQGARLEEKQKNRWLFLQKVYEISEGMSDTHIVNMYEIGKNLGWDREKTGSISDYLHREGLLTPFNGGNITLTHQGVKEVEETEKSPDKPTFHFPLHITNHISGDNIGGDKVMRDKIGTQINNSTDLTQASQDIKALLDRLSADYPNDSNRVLGAKAIDTVDSNPALKSRIINGLKAGGFAALEKAIDHPVAKFFVEGAKEAFKS
jgi:Mn-dependent DtxR family transcriptional regulator